MFFAVFSAYGFSQTVSSKDAFSAAKNFWVIDLDKSVESTKLVYAHKTGIDTSVFVFNFNNSGFVMISGIYSAEPILAYSTEGVFSSDMAPACQQWIQNYSYEIQTLRESKNIMIHKNWTSLLNNKAISGEKSQKIVSPLVTTKWDQGKFYNYMCPQYPSGPDGRCVTGCVATAMGQVMKFFNYPQTGLGYHYYSHPHFGNIGADFSATTYDWTPMGVYANNTNKEAIGTLLFHCGVSVDMDYGPNASGSHTELAATALKDYFHYRNTVSFLQRNDYLITEWISILKDNLDEGHPMIYSGTGNGGGHAWVCDGYDASDKFHMNWGWSGSNNGYYLVTNINPGVMTFEFNQGAVVNIAPYFAPYCSTNRVFSDSTRTFHDGSGYSYYWNNTNCDWLIQPAGAEKVLLQFTNFKTESNNDVVSIYDGTSTSATLLGSYSGSETPPLLVANSGKMFITFSSDASIQELGWSATYWCLKQGDGIEENGRVSLQVFPNPATEFVTIISPETEITNETIEIFSITGSLVKVYRNSFENQKSTLNISDLDKGLYIISMKTDNGIYKSRLIKD